MDKQRPLGASHSAWVLCGLHGGDKHACPEVSLPVGGEPAGRCWGLWVWRQLGLESWGGCGLGLVFLICEPGGGTVSGEWHSPFLSVMTKIKIVEGGLTEVGKLN